MSFATDFESRNRLVWTTSVAVLVSVTAGLGLVLTSGDSSSVTAATPTTTEPSTTTDAPASTTSPAIAIGSDTFTPTEATTRTASTTTAVGAGEVANPVVSTTTVQGESLMAGSPVADVTELQRQLNAVTGSTLELDGLYGEDTTTAVRNFQTVIGVDPTGVADPVTRWTLAEAAARITLPTSGLPTIGAGGANGCQVAVVGDSLMAGAEELHAKALDKVGCAAAVDGEGGRSLAYGWQCRVDRDGRRPLLLFEDRIPGNETCAPSGLTLLKSWSDAIALGDVVVVALGTNDSGLFDKSRWQSNWVEAMRLAGGRPVVFLTTQARPGSDQYDRQKSYAIALRQWCNGQRLCILADWANTAAANDPASYVDTVHLNLAGTRARASFIADVVAALLTGRPIPNPQPPPTPTIPPAGTTTTTAVATEPASTSTTPSSPTPPATTIAPTTTTTPDVTTSAPATTTTAAPTTTTTTVASTTTTTTATTTTSTTATTAPAPPDSGD
ncbi:MAG TPA: peptidoglycan-binding protein [Ilumatobacteraceae bacterium]|nr:peptidoglycan-binding protein [Ilumatobacteraceae bacterium]